MNNILSKKITRISIITILLLCVFFVSEHQLASRSEPYKATQKFLQVNPTLKLHVGNITKMRIAFFGFSINYSGPKGNAEFEVVVSGEKKDSIANVSLDRRTGIWVVVAANLKNDSGGDPITL